MRKKQKVKTPWGKLFLVLLVFGLLGSCVKSNPKNDAPTSAVTVVTLTPSPTSEPEPVRASAVAELAPEVAPELTPEPTPTPKPINTYVANLNTGKFHKPTCPSVDEMAEKNRATYETTCDQMLALGYEPCGRCHP